MGRTLKDPHTTAICTTGRSPMLGVRKTVFENQHGNCLSGLVTSTRLGRGSIKPHVRTVKVLGMGLFAFQEHVHLWQGVTYWTLYQSRVPRVLRPFGIPAHIACGRWDSPHRRLHKRRTRLSAARKRHFCGM